MSAVWVKDKGMSYDLEFTVTNVSKSNIVFRLDNMQCFKGTEQGILKYTFFNTGKKTLGFTPGQLRQFRMKCSFQAKVPGDPRIIVNQIFDNPSNDGVTEGKVVDQNIEWKMANPS